MNRPLDTLAVIPLTFANLCPQCDAVTNQRDCPVCHSQTLVLARILAEKKEDTGHV